jgi:uncharacterized membrane protein YdbT with pleckstrin-like domain
MAYPKQLLSPGEEVVTEFRPHWTAVGVPLVLTLVAAAGAVTVALLVAGNARWIALAGIALVWLILTLRRFLTWLFTEHVVTNERVIHRYGIVSKHGREIPLEMINSVSFSQNVFERIVGSGDLLIESAGETGQTRYTDIPRPEQLQTTIYRNRETRMFTLERGGVPASAAEQLQILSRLHDEGKLSDEEFSAQKQRLLGN